MKSSFCLLAGVGMALGALTAFDTAVSAMPLDGLGLRSGATTPSAAPIENARLVCGRRGCYRTYGYRYGYAYRRYRPYYGYGYRPYYFGLPGLGVRVY